MEACELVRLFVNKAMAPPMPRRRGNPGYGRLKALRLLVYSRLVGLENDTRVVAHLEKHGYVARALGFRHGIPDRTTVGRWWRRYADALEDVFRWICRMVTLLVPTELLIVDSSPLEDLHDLEAEEGVTSRGWFRGFKLHASVNQHGLPLRHRVTPGNRHDSPVFPALIEDLEAPLILGDAGYDSRANRRLAQGMGAVPVIASNPRRGIRRGLPGEALDMLRRKRYLVEQLFSLVKEPLLKGCWRRPRGLLKKAAIVTAALTALNIDALQAILEGDSSLKAVSRYWVR